MKQAMQFLRQHTAQLRNMLIRIRSIPGLLILSGALMFEYMGWDEVAQKIYSGLEKTIQSKMVTYDFHRLMENAKLLKTSEFADAIISNI